MSDPCAAPTDAVRAALGVVLLVSFLGLPTRPAAGAPVQVYDGAAKIGNLDRITVVYPAADGEQGEIHRDSARLRASYLAERYGVIATIADDDAVTDDQLAGHLLLLGWDNGLLGSDRAPRPFRRDDEGLQFLGYDAGTVGQDLLWMHVSPYNPSKYLVFWSRIDPALDRFLSFPFVGSDWAIYHDYLIVAQGMFTDEARFPPLRNTLAEHETPWLAPPPQRNSAHYVLRHDPETLLPEEAQRILDAREQALAQAAEWLGQPPREGFRIELFVYDDVEEKHLRTGVADAVHSVAHRRELYMPRRHAAVPNPHEEVHLLADHLFGACTLSAFYEGLAFALEHRGREPELGAYAALIEERGGMPGFDVLFDDEKLRKRSADGLGFAASGLLAHWLESVGGMDAVGRAYALRMGNVSAGLGRIAGADAENRFRTWAAGLAARSRDELTFQRTLARAQERGRVGDVFGRAEAMADAVRLRPDDPELRYRLALAQIEAGRIEEAKTELERLVETDPAEPAYLKAYVPYQLGRVLEQLGERERAASQYRRVLELPDQHDSHRRAREALVQLEGTAGR